MLRTAVDFFIRIFALGIVLMVTGCTHTHAGREPISSEKARKEAVALGTDLVSLAPEVNPEEAARTAAAAVYFSRQLAGDYQVVRPALLHNFLVNTGFRKRGLCYQWAEDLARELQSQRLLTLRLHWAIARQGTVREHNCLVLTARGKPFASGIVLDAWRHSGHLVWKKVNEDGYPWVEGELTPTSVSNASP